MATAFHPHLRAAVLVAVLAGAHCLAAGAPPAQRDRRVTNSFTLLTTAPAPTTAAGGNSNGVGVGPAKPVVSNPYHVPLIQNAGSLRSR